MGFHCTLTLLFSFAVFALIVLLSGPLVTCLYSLFGGFVFPTASFLHDALLAAFWLLGVLVVLLLLCYALGLGVSSSVPVNQLFLLGLLLGFYGVLFWLGQFLYSIPYTILQFFGAHLT